MAKKLGCASCGGTMKKMSKGGMATKAMGPGKQPFAAGIPYFIGAGQTGPESMKKGGTKKEHPITAFRKANDARNERVMKSLPKAKDGMSTLATELYGKKKELAHNNVIRYDPQGNVLRNKPTAKTPAAPKSPEPVRKPSIEFGDPNVGFKYNKPQPKTKYEDAVINTKSPSTRTIATAAGKPKPSTTSPVNTSGYTSKKGAAPTPKRIPEELKRKINMKKDRVNAAKVAIAGPIGYAASNMFKKKGGAVKSKKK